MTVTLCLGRSGADLPLLGLQACRAPATHQSTCAVGSWLQAQLSLLRTLQERIPLIKEIPVGSKCKTWGPHGRKRGEGKRDEGKRRWSTPSIVRVGWAGQAGQADMGSSPACAACLLWEPLTGLWIHLPFSWHICEMRARRPGHRSLCCGA